MIAETNYTGEQKEAQEVFCFNENGVPTGISYFFTNVGVILENGEELRGNILIICFYKNIFDLSNAIAYLNSIQPFGYKISRNKDNNIAWRKLKDVENYKFMWALKE